MIFIRLIMERLSKGKLVVVLLLLLLLGSGLFYVGYLWSVYRTLNSWVSHVQRPGDTLLYAGEHHQHWIAVFDAGDDQLAIFMRSFLKQHPPFTGTISLEDKHGESVLPKIVKLAPLKPDGWMLADFFLSEGCVFQIRPTYQGDILLTYAVGEGKETEAREKNVFLLGNDDFLIVTLQITWSKQ